MAPRSRQRWAWANSRKSDRVRCVNLIPAARRQAKACRTRLRKWAVGLAVYVAAAVAGYVACFALADKSGQSLDGQIVNARSGIRGSGRAVLALRRRIADAEKQLAIARDVGRHPDWSLLLAMLAERLGDDVVLENCLLEPVKEVRPETKTPDEKQADPNLVEAPKRARRFCLKLNGFAKSQTAVSLFVLRLEKTGLFERVRLIKAHRRKFLKGDAFMFRVECALGREGGARN